MHLTFSVVRYFIKPFIFRNKTGFWTRDKKRKKRERMLFKENNYKLFRAPKQETARIYMYTEINYPAYMPCFKSDRSRITGCIVSHWVRFEWPFFLPRFARFMEITARRKKFDRFIEIICSGAFSPNYPADISGNVYPFKSVSKTYLN